MNVFLKHGRYINPDLITPKNPKGITSRGGVTIAVLSDGGSLKWGVSKCNLSDVFSKKLGVNKALGRAKMKEGLTTGLLDKEEITELVDKLISVIINHRLMPENQDDFEYAVDQIGKGIGKPINKAS